jgi:hypothetical protein
MRPRVDFAHTPEEIFTRATGVGMENAVADTDIRTQWTA